MSQIDAIRGSGGGGGKSSGGSARAPVESPDSLRSIQYASILFLLGEGEVGGLVDGLKSVTLDGTPIQNADGTFNFKNVLIEERTGTQIQSYIPGFNAAESESSVGVEVTNAVSVTRTISNANATAARITLGVPQLTLQDLTNGDLSGSSVSYAIDLQANGGGFVAQALRQIYSSANFSVTASTLTATIASTKFKLTVDWAGSATQSEQTCTFKLQYRAVGAGTWLDYITHTFSGVGTSSGSLTGSAFSAIGTPTFTPPSGTKTFDVTLASGTYEFRVLKTNGSARTPLFGGGSTLQTGTAYGGAVTLSKGEIYQPSFSDTITGKTTSRYQRSKRIELTGAAPWDIRVRRITADSTNAYLQNKTFFDSLTEIVEAKLRYPNRHIVGLRVDAKQFQSIPTVGFFAKGRLVQVPTNYDPLTRSYSGTWDGNFQNAWTDNPAWVFYDLVTHDRYGLGQFIDASQVDKWGLYSIAQFCDEMVDDGFGGIEPRFTCNLYLQTREQAYTVLTNLAGIFRGMAWWGAGNIRVTNDAPSDATQIFSAANVLGGEFSYAGSSARVRHTVALVTWNDPEDNSRTKVEYVEDAEGIARYGVVQTEVVAFGCSSRGQAHRMGRAIIYTELYETETVSFAAGLDAVFCSPGEIIKTTDPIRAGARMGGRLISATTTQVVLDAAFTIEAGVSYTITCVLPDGSLEDRTVTTGASTTDTLTVSPAFSQAPLALSIWVMNSDTLIAETWRVIGMAERDKTSMEITALTYRADKYQAIENGIVLQPLPISLLSASPDMPSGLLLTESLYLSGLATVSVKATISWDVVRTAASYTVVYTRNSENAVTIANILDNSIDITQIEPGEYAVQVYAVNALGVRGQAASINSTVYGKSSLPEDMPSLALNPLGSVGLFTWDASTSLDVLVGGLVRFRYSPDIAATWDTAADLPERIPGSASSAALPLNAGVYLAKFEDSTGNQSLNAISVITNAAQVIALNAVETLIAQPGWSGTKVDTQYVPAFSGFALISAHATDPLDYSAGVVSDGTYSMGSVDLGAVQISRISVLLEAYGINVGDTWDSAELIDGDDFVDGEGAIDDARAVMWMRYTDDNPSASPTWSAWQPVLIADISARAYEFELRLTSANTVHNVVVKRAEVVVDMPDRTEAGNDIASGAAAYNITYSRPFKVTPALAITAQNMATGDYYVLASKTVSGATITFKNAAGTTISRTFDYLAKGY